MDRSPERRAGGGTITLMYTLVFLGGLTTTLSFSPGTSSPFLGGKSSALRRAQVVPQAVTGATALTAATTRSSTGVWRKGIRNGLRMRGAIRRKRSWGQGMWNKFTSPPAAGRAHDEVTFRSGCEGRTLTIPQGWFAARNFVFWQSSPSSLYHHGCQDACPLIFFLVLFVR